MLVQNLGIEADQLLGGEGVQVAANRVHRPRDLFRGAAGGSLEQHVFDEVRQAVLLADFPAGAAADPDADRDRSHVGHRLGNHADPVRKGRHFNVAQCSRFEVMSRWEARRWKSRYILCCSTFAGTGIR